MTALIALERGYAFQTLVAAARLEHDDVDDVDEHDVEPDAPEPGGDPGPLPTPTDDDLPHDASCLPGCTQHDGPDIEETMSDEYAPTADEDFNRWLAAHDAQLRDRIAKAIEDLPTTWPSGVKHSPAWMRHEAADVARETGRP